ncbi:MAG: NAD-dependent epimerase/dehydratase family protein [Bacteroidota bacterium]
MKPISVIITGASGMVGEGVLHACLNSDAIERVLVVGRRSCEVSHPKLTEVLTPDFFNLESIQSSLRGYDACFFCLGVSSIGLKEPEYTRLTHTLTTGFADAVAQENPGSVFCYISGAGTDSTEVGRSMWARVKGRTENDLQKKNFRAAYCFRPGYIHPTPGMKFTLPMYRYVDWAWPIFRTLFPNYCSTLQQIGQAMINSVHHGPAARVLEVKDINQLATQ